MEKISLRVRFPESRFREISDFFNFFLVIIWDSIDTSTFLLKM